MSIGKFRFRHSVLVLIFVSLTAGISAAQQVAPRQRIVQTIDNARLTKLPGNTHPLARVEFDRGRAPDSLAADRMLLLLSRTPEQDAALTQLLDDQQTEGSANYHRWLTPEEFGQKFGAADADIQAITAWLQTQGFQVNRIAGAKNVIEFSGTAGQVRNSFHTELRKYKVKGSEYWANATDPQIPTALASVVKGVVALNNFPHLPQNRKLGAFKRDAQGDVHPLLTVQDGSGTKYYAVGPADFATIYKTSSLLSAGTNGTGQTIAIIGETNINLQDVTDFRTMFALTGGSASVVLDGPDPGIVDGAETEALLDMEWAGAVAPGATLKLVSAQSTSTTAGIFLAANYAIQQNLAGVLSMSYGSCEAKLGNGGNQFVQSLWQQAAAQGITVVISSGDEGSAGCDYHGDAYIATHGLAVNGFASTPYNVAVGGTDFDDASIFTAYWNSGNNSTTLGSAKSYIPEMTWNETCAATATAGNLNVCPTITDPSIIPDGISVVAGSGGASNCSTSTLSSGQVVCQSGTRKPSWQTGTGVPADGVRDVPDISLFASGGGTSSKSFYVLCEADAMPGYPSCQIGSYNFFAIGGTSASAPSFAGMVALFNQKAGARLGNLNYLLYSIAAKSGSSCTSSGSQANSCTFNDVVKGNISVPCVAGTPNCSETGGTATGVLVSGGKPAFTTTTGYDLATGLGSVNAANLADAIVTAKGGFTPTTTALTLNSGTTQVTAKHGDPINVAVNVTPTAATGPVAVQNSTGKSIDTATLVAGTSAWTSTLFPGGVYGVTAHYPGDGTRAASDSNSVQVSISPEDSKTFLEVMSWDDSGNFLGFNSPTVAYGSSYILRMDVGDAAATLSNSTGLNSKCWMGTASCPGGTVTVTANGAPLDGGSFKLNSAGHAEDQSIQLVPGTYALAANYPGDASYNASSGTASLTVTKAPTTTSATINKSVEFGTQVWMTLATTYPGSGVLPTGSQSFIVDGTPTNMGGNGGISDHRITFNGSYWFTTIGSHTLAAEYSGDGNYQGSSSPAVSFEVVPATTTIYVSAGPNPTTPLLPVTIRANIGNTADYGQKDPTGSITFFDNGAAMGAPVSVSQSAASMQYTFTTLGTHTITATYSGDTYFKSSSTPPSNAVTLTAQSQLTLGYMTISSVPSPTLVNQSAQLSTVICSAYALPAPTGTVTFTDGGVPLTDSVTYQTPGSNSNCLVATVTHTFTTVGTHNIGASYSGDSLYSPTALPNLQLRVVNSFAVSVALYSNTPYPVVGQPTNMTAYLTGQVTSGPTLTGTVAFFDGQTQLTDSVTYGPYGVSSAMTATINHTFTTDGAHNIVAKYSGDANYAATESASTPVTIAGVLVMSGLSNSYGFTSAGGTQTATVWVANNNTSSANVTLTCTPESPNTSCSLSPASLQLSSRGQATSVLSFTVPMLTAGSHVSDLPWRSGSGFLLGSVFACCVLATRKRKKLLVIASLLTLALGLLSCGGGGGSSSGGGGGNPLPTSKTYHFTVTATDGTNTTSQVITAVVLGN